MSGFRTIEISDPRFERDGLRYVTVQSPALGRRGDITLFVPPEVDGLGSVPLAVLLHGVYGSHWAWSHSAGAHRTAQEAISAGEVPPLVLAMPSDGLWGDGSGYLAHGDADYERWIIGDVVAAATEVVPAVDRHSPLLLGGLSMGGYGALRIGANHGDRVRAVSAHSAVTDLDDLAAFSATPIAHGGASDADYSVLHAVRANRERLPALRFDCGTSDPLLASNQRLHEQLETARIPHVYAEFCGAHEWHYWQAHLRDSLLFFASVV